MRVMLDTNVLVSALLFPGQKMNDLMYKLSSEHHLILSSYVVNELLEVTRRKFPGKEETVKALLKQLPYELTNLPKQLIPGLFRIRDIKDYPVLYSAVIENVDVLITGDNDFTDLDIDKPEIITPAEFLNKY